MGYVRNDERGYLEPVDESWKGSVLLLFHSGLFFFLSVQNPTFIDRHGERIDEVNAFQEQTAKQCCLLFAGCLIGAATEKWYYNEIKNTLTLMSSVEYCV